MRGVMIDGNELRRVRKRLALTAADLESATGVTRGTISKAERQGGPIDLPIVTTLCKYLKIPTEQLTRGDGDALKAITLVPAIDTPQPIRITIDLSIQQATLPGGVAEQLRAFLRKVLKDLDDQDPVIRSGSTLVEWRLSARDVLRLFELLDEGKLSAFQVSSVELIGYDAPTSLLRQIVLIDRDLRRLRRSVRTDARDEEWGRRLTDRARYVRTARRAQRLHRSGAYKTLEDAYLAVFDGVKPRDKAKRRKRKRD